MITKTKYMLIPKFVFGDDVENLSLYIFYTKNIVVLFLWIALAFCRFSKRRQGVSIQK